MGAISATPAHTVDFNCVVIAGMTRSYGGSFVHL